MTTLALLTLLLAPATGLSTEAPAASLERALPDLLEEGRIPGLSIAVLEDGAVTWSDVFGVRNLESGEPVVRDTVFEAASLSKPVFAYLALRLVERGELDLDRPLAEILPYPRLEHDERYRKITARLVLSHTTGLPNWGGDPLRLNFDPGKRFNYSGEGYVYLQKTVEKLTGRTLDEVARREVFEPLGMKNSSYVWRADFEATASARHSSQGAVSPLRREETGNAAASLLTTADDYSRFLQAMLAPEGLSEKSRDLMLRAQTSLADAWGKDAEAKAKLSWGLGWGLDPLAADRRTFWHWGDNGDAKAFTLVDADSGRGFVYFANSNDGLSIAAAVVDAVFGEPSWAVRWIGYEAHDDPDRRLRLKLASAFAESSQAGDALYKELRRSKQLTEALADAAGRELLAGSPEAALPLLERNAKSHKRSTKAHRSLGEAYLAAGRLPDAAKSLLRASELDPENERTARSARWVEDLVRAEASPPEVSRDVLAAYAGAFGPRKVRLEGDRLLYQRDGDPAYPLRPLTAELFALEGMDDFRLRFVTDDSGRAVKLEGLYFDGRTDESPRDP